MTPEDEHEIAKRMLAALSKRRGYADFYNWPTNRDVEEWGVANALRETLQGKGQALFHNLKRRGRGNDPPDCEATDANGNQVAIETTELVCAEAIQAYKQGSVYEWADWPRERLITSLADRIATKGARYPTLKGGPYAGGYVIIIYTDEPMLPFETVQNYLSSHKFRRPEGVTRAFFLLSYDPKLQHCPYFELPLIS